MKVIPINEEGAKLVVEMLSSSRSHGQYISKKLHYGRYTKALTQIREATGCLEQTARIYAGVVNQAYVLGESTDWIERELGFEAKAQRTGKRTELIRASLTYEGAGTDDSLDLYNQRVARFV